MITNAAPRNSKTAAAAPPTKNNANIRTSAVRIVMAANPTAPTTRATRNRNGGRCDAGATRSRNNVAAGTPRAQANGQSENTRAMANPNPAASRIAAG